MINYINLKNFSLKNLKKIFNIKSKNLIFDTLSKILNG